LSSSKALVRGFFLNRRSSAADAGWPRPARKRTLLPRSRRSGAVVLERFRMDGVVIAPQRFGLAGAMLGERFAGNSRCRPTRGALQSWLRLEGTGWPAGAAGWIWVRTRARRHRVPPYLESDSPGRTKGTGAWRPERKGCGELAQCMNERRNLRFSDGLWIVLSGLDCFRWPRGAGRP